MATQMAVMMQPPQQQPLMGQTMNAEQLIQSEGVMVRQLTSECCRPCCCQPNIHWTVHAYQHQIQDFDTVAPTGVWIQEEAPYCGRCCSFFAPGSRKTTYRVLEDVPPSVDTPVANKAGQAVYTFEKEGTCGQNVVVAITNNGIVRCPCCCYLPYLDAKDRNGNLMGRTEYLCDMCLFVPKFQVLEADTKTVAYLVRPDTCVGGICVQCKCDGVRGKCCRVPYYIRHPSTREKYGDAQISDLFAGFKNECCTKRNIYSVKYPDMATPAHKATLLATSLLIDIALVEQEDG